MARTADLQRVLQVEDALVEALAASGDLREAAELHSCFLGQMEDCLRQVSRLLWEIRRAGRHEDAKAMASAALVAYGRVGEQQALLREWGDVIAADAEQVALPLRRLMGEAETERWELQRARQTPKRKVVLSLVPTRPLEPMPAA